MKLSKPSSRKSSKPKAASYRSGLRQEQAQLTLGKIRDAVLEVFRSCNSADSITYKAVAEKAGVTEMTVYRYFTEREALLKCLWERINATLGPGLGMPTSSAQLLAQNQALHEGFAQNSALASASLMSSQGREMRAALNPERQAAFLKIVRELNPSLSPRSARLKAGILQLLHSAYAWDSLQLHWDFSGQEAGLATQEALETFLKHIKNVKEKI